MQTFRFTYHGQQYDLTYSVYPDRPDARVVLDDVEGVNGSDPNHPPDDLIENYRLELERDLFEDDTTPAD